ncbi:MAG: BsuPI-related putative proteinase inhibitor [Archangium sp.]
MTTLAVLSLSLWACGPDAMAVIGDDDVDGTESFDAELTSTSRSNSWFPMQEGNSWTLKSATGETKTLTLTQVGSGMGLLTGLYDAPVWVGVASDSATTLFQWKNETWEPLIRFGYASTSWKTNTNACNGYTGRRSATGATVSTPAGSYTDTRSIEFNWVTSPTARCAQPVLGRMSFVPNVGLVSIETGAGIRYDLASAKVNGKTIPTTTASNISAKVALDKVNYESVPNTIRCITTPCPSNAQTAEATVEFSVQNTGSASQTWQFNTGCQYDVEIVSSTGRVVRRLSEGRACTYSLTSLTLSAGQSKTYSVKVPLADREGLQLDGTYSVRAKLIPSSNAATAPTASSSLSVVVLTP